MRQSKRISEAGLIRLADEEGFVDHVYLDGPDHKTGNPTIGFGHLKRPGEIFPDRITREEGLALFRSDIARFEQAVNDIGVELTQNQFDALVSFAFNVGVGSFVSSTLRLMVKDENFGCELIDPDGTISYCGAAGQFERWVHAGGKVDDRLVRRRARERDIFLTPDELGTPAEVASDRA